MRSTVVSIVLEARQYGGLVGAIKFAGIDLPDRNPGCADGFSKRLSEHLTLVIEIALLGDVGEGERIGIGLVAERRTVPNKDYVSTRPQGLGQVFEVGD